MGGVYTRPHRRKLPKRSRTRPIRGKGDDEGKYFRCWNCGFICNKDRDELGDAESNAGDNHLDYHNIAPTDPYTNDSASKRLCLGGNTGHYHVMMTLMCAKIKEYYQDEIGDFYTDETGDKYEGSIVGVEDDAVCSELKTITHDYTSNITRGCPFCGSTNWMGKY